MNIIEYFEREDISEVFITGLREETSKRVQSFVFNYRFSWGGSGKEIKHTEHPVIILNNFGITNRRRLTYLGAIHDVGDYISFHSKEISFEEFEQKFMNTHLSKISKNYTI